MCLAKGKLLSTDHSLAPHKVPKGRLSLSLHGCDLRNCVGFGNLLEAVQLGSWGGEAQTSHRLCTVP